MQRFHLPIILVAILAWFFWLYLLYFISPVEILGGTEFSLRIQPVSLFLIILAIATTLTSSLIFYFLSAIFLGNPDPRGLMRRSLRRGTFVAVVVMTLGLLRLTQTFNFITAFLTIASAAMLEITLSSN